MALLLLPSAAAIALVSAPALDFSNVAPTAPVMVAQAVVEQGAAAADEQETPPIPARAPETPPVSFSQADADADANEAAPASSGDVIDEALVFADKSDEEIIETVRGYIESIGVLTGDFGQVSPSGSVATGKFFLRRPNQLRFEYAPPTPLLIVATQGNVYVEDKDLETTDFYPIKKTPLRFLLSKKVDLADAKVIGVDRGVDTVAVTFASDDGETEGELSLILRAPDLALEQWVVRDLQNGITVVTLSNQTAGGKVSSRLFTPPEAGGKFLKN